ncbi:hypothetical protein DFS34DRAFT_650910 [Phlyctochytrium arcticum]|nr:hypothetical protein DFS34DRAFT_650910 [Phlyctochytrium arcticum]
MGVDSTCDRILKFCLVLKTLTQFLCGLISTLGTRPSWRIDNTNQTAPLPVPPCPLLVTIPAVHHERQRGGAQPIHASWSTAKEHVPRPRPCLPKNHPHQQAADLVNNRAYDQCNEAIEKREDRRNQLTKEWLKLSREQEHADGEEHLEERTTTLAEAELALKQRMEERLAARENWEAAATENLRKDELAICKIEAEAARAHAEAAKVQAELKLMEIRARGFN